MDTIKEILNNEDKLKAVIEEGFASVDTDTSGSIDVKELGVAMKTISTELNIDPPTDEDIKECFTALDTDQSKGISKEEFGLFVKNLLKMMVDAAGESA